MNTQDTQRCCDVADTISLLGYELDGVIIDVKTSGFDDTCLDTITYVRDQLLSYRGCSNCLCVLRRRTPH